MQTHNILSLIYGGFKYDLMMTLDSGLLLGHPVQRLPIQATAVSGGC